LFKRHLRQDEPASSDNAIKHAEEIRPCGSHEPIADHHLWQLSDGQLLGRRPPEEPKDET
jgi:hypothetical protein